MAKPAAKQAAKTKQTTAVTPSNTNAGAMIIQSDQMPAHIQQNDRRGTEKLQMSDLVIPRLEICQGLSPSVKRGDPGYIEGAAAGMLNNSVTRALYGDSVKLVPVHFAVQFLVWRDRKAAEAWNQANPRSKKPIDGFFGAYNSQEEANDRCEEEGGEAECIEVVDTPTHLCLILDPISASVDEIMIPMPRTKAKISRQWNTIIKLGGGPRFSRVYEVSTVLQKNDQGDFYNYSISPVGYAGEALYQQAERLYTNIEKGSREIKMDTKDYSTDTSAPEGTDARM